MRQAVRAIIIRSDEDLLVMRRIKFGQEYYTLAGGGVEPGETFEQALRREIEEEASLRVLSARHVFTENAGDPYGIQYIFLCEYAGGTPRLAADSEEAGINRLGQNLHEPMWLPFTMLPKVAFRSEALKYTLLDALKHGFPEQPEVIDPGKYHNQIYKQGVH